jgi:hypothetical protein
LIQLITDFIQEIGLSIEWSEFDDTTVVPGIKIDSGRLLVNEARLLYPGDLLHEAGHLAVLTADQRRGQSGDLGFGPAEEMMAIAWSWAALKHLQLEPEVVFHEAGYRGGSQSIIENFSGGYYIGVPTLEWLGLTREYPRMLKWLRD